MVSLNKAGLRVEWASASSGGFLASWEFWQWFSWQWAFCLPISQKDSQASFGFRPLNLLAQPTWDFEEIEI